MHDLPHRYTVGVEGTPEGDLALTADRLPAIASASPAEFDGPGDRWSPETLLVAAVADCLALTFRGVARASKLSWTSLRCEAVGTLDRVDRVMQFTRFDLHVDVIVPPDTSAEQARRVLDKAERTCLIANSLKAEIFLESEIHGGAAALSAG
jgi:organic hydroperoxide reductase OsmC/OhrA